MAYIHYDSKANGVVYASVYESFREAGKVNTKRIETLGRVIDRENGIFRKHGELFQYTIESGKQAVPDTIQTETVLPDHEKLILDFGDAWFLEEYINKLPFCQSIYNLLPDESDSVLSLLFYHLLTDKQANCHANIWYEGSYAYLSFPKANLTSQNISRVLKKLGSEEVQRDFFEAYLASLYPEHGTAGIIIDSTGVPNATKMEVTQVSDHNGKVSREVRVIYVIDRSNGMPIYFRYVAGNIVDVSTLVTTVYELEQYGVSTEHAILDAGYFSEKNAIELLDNGIPFLTRLAPNKTLFKDAARDNLDDLMSQKYAYRYGERVVFIKKIPMELDGHAVFVYLCIDEDMYLMQHKKTILEAMDNKKDCGETDASIKKLGTFALLSSEDIEENQLLPLYYTRQQVEQVFDISKNYADMLPIRVQSEEAFAGHMVLCFIATAIMQNLQKELTRRKSQKAKNLNANSIFAYLRNQKCKVYTDFCIPQEARKEANTIYDIFKVQAPHKIPLTSIEV